MILSLIASAVVLVAIGVGYSWSRLWAVVPVFIVLLMLIGAGGSPANLWSAIGVTAVAVGCRLWNAPLRYFWMAAAVVAYMPYVIGAPLIFAHNQEMHELRTRFPVQSLAGRLAYESKASQAEVAPLLPTRERREQTERYEEQLGQAAIDSAWSIRSRSLRSLFATHDAFVADFVNAQGFGVRRTIALPPRKRFVKLPAPEPIPVSPETVDEPALPEDTIGNTQETEGPTGVRLGQFHVSGVVDFVNSEGFGALDWRTDGRSGGDRERSIGFQAHGFRRRPEPPDQAGVTWKIEQLQLVSLLKHETPAAYLSENLPRMDELREAAMRPLNAFEASALEQLRSREELVVHETRDTIEMLGAIRAIRVCADCHQVPERTLLGAFSYRLQRPGVRKTKSRL